MNLNLLDKNDLSTLEEKIDKILLLLKEGKSTQKPEWMRSSEVKKMLHVSDATLKNYRDSGKLKFSKFGGTYYYLFTDLVDVMEHSQHVSSKNSLGGENE